MMTEDSQEFSREERRRAIAILFLHFPFYSRIFHFCFRIFHLLTDPLFTEKL